MKTTREKHKMVEIIMPISLTLTACQYYSTTNGHQTSFVFSYSW
jgi:hypothetical protein